MMLDAIALEHRDRAIVAMIGHETVIARFGNSRRSRSSIGIDR